MRIGIGNQIRIPEKIWICQHKKCRDSFTVVSDSNLRTHGFYKSIHEIHDDIRDGNLKFDRLALIGLIFTESSFEEDFLKSDFVRSCSGYEIVKELELFKVEDILYDLIEEMI